MKKTIGLLALSLMLLGCNNPTIPLEKFSLESKYYQDGGLVELKLANDFNEKVEADESFVVFLHSPTCQGCVEFKPRISAFAANQNIQVLSMNVSILEYTSLKEHAKYTPSVYLYKQGEMTYMTDPTTQDKSAFSSESAFTDWFFARINKLES